MVQSRSVPHLILSLPDARLGMSLLFILLLNHELNRFIAYACLLEIRDLLSRQAVALLRERCKEDQHKKRLFDPRVYTPAVEISLDKSQK